MCSDRLHALLCCSWVGLCGCFCCDLRRSMLLRSPTSFPAVPWPTRCKQLVHPAEKNVGPAQASRPLISSPNLWQRVWVLSRCALCFVTGYSNAEFLHTKPSPLFRMRAQQHRRTESQANRQDRVCRPLVMPAPPRPVPSRPVSSRLVQPTGRSGSCRGRGG